MLKSLDEFIAKMESHIRASRRKVVHNFLLLGLEPDFPALLDYQGSGDPAAFEICCEAVTGRRSSG